MSGYFYPVQSHELLKLVCLPVLQDLAYSVSADISTSNICWPELAMSRPVWICDLAFA